MFYYLHGKVARIMDGIAVIDCNGVGYACHTSRNTLASLKLNEDAMLFTSLNVREDALELFGFSTEKELSLYKKLIGVSGVGPKAALSILSCGTTDSLILSIMAGDEKVITSAPGVGKKIAQRVILELKDKLGVSEIDARGESFSGSINTVIPQDKTAEATAALASLGYNSAEIARALREIPMAEMDLQEIIKAALKKMAKG